MPRVFGTDGVRGLANREVTPSEGILIDHDAHSEVGIACSWCHNRVAHPEDFELTLTHPETGEPNEKHDDFMEMTACFRCHGLEDDANAPGACGKCHPADFELKPPSHFGIHREIDLLIFRRGLILYEVNNP